MKKNLFWKVCAIVFLIWLFLLLWTISWDIVQVNGAYYIRVNKLTGQEYSSWKISQKQKEQSKGHWELVKENKK